MEEPSFPQMLKVRAISVRTPEPHDRADCEVLDRTWAWPRVTKATLVHRVELLPYKL